MSRIIIFLFSLCFTSSVYAQEIIDTAHVRLSGRNVIGSVSRPSFTTNSEGVVVVQIKVNQYGNVVEALAGVDGTTIPDKGLWNAARIAAMKTNFNMSAEAVPLQIGTITYSYKRTETNDDSSFQDNKSLVFTPVKEIVEAEGHESYMIKAKYVKTYDLSKLIILVEEDDYIIPIQLVKNDLGAEKRFLSLNLKAGDVLFIRGSRNKIFVDYEYYYGLIGSTILKVEVTNSKNESHSVSKSDSVPFQLVEEKPSFKGGDANEFSKWVNSRLVYPESAKKKGVEGRVTVQFTIKADGSMSNVAVLRGIDDALDAEAVRVVSSSPKWKPGRNRDRSVDVTYTFPVIFQLR